MFLLTGLLFPPDSANTEQCLLDNADAQAQDGQPMFSSISESLWAGQQPDAPEDKHRPSLRTLQAHPQKSVTRAESIAGAEAD